MVRVVKTTEINKVIQLYNKARLYDRPSLGIPRPSRIRITITIILMKYRWTNIKEIVLTAT